MTTIFPVSSQKGQLLQERMNRLGIREEDLEEQFVRSSGPGGQKVNKTSSCVLLHHLPSGIQVRCQKTRNQGLNRLFARRILCEKIEEKIFKIKTQKQKEIEKIRRQKKRRTRRSKEKMLREKHHRAEIKKMRRVSDSD